jgi:hypothetical protein
MGLNFLNDVYNPLAKKDKTQDVVVYPAGDDTTSCGHPDDSPAFPAIPDPIPEIRLPMNSWQDSGPVLLLSEYMKMNKDLGCRIFLAGKDPALSFSPGLGSQDLGTDRWQIAQNAINLFFNAVADIRYLVDHGLLELQTRR